jgi:hypothetical protein
MRTGLFFSNRRGGPHVSISFLAEVNIKRLLTTQVRNVVSLR